MRRIQQRERTTPLSRVLERGRAGHRAKRRTRGRPSVKWQANPDRGSLSGLGYVEDRVGPRDVVVTDTCWGFLAGWLLQRPVLAAQDSSLILPKSEIAPAKTAARILYGGRAGSEIAQRLGVRYALVDPLCTHQTGLPVRPPDIGTPVFASTHLVVLSLKTRQAQLSLPNGE